MYVIYPADEVVSLTYSSQLVPRPRQRPTLDVLLGAPPPAPSRPLPSSLPVPSSASTPSKTAPPELAERATASPTPSHEPSTKQHTKAVKLLKKFGRHEDPGFGKIVRTPIPDECELPAPLPTPAFSRKVIADRDFDALFEVASTPQFGANIRVTTPEPDRRSDLSAIHFPSPSTSSLSLLSPRHISDPSPSPVPSTRTSSPRQSTPLRSSFEGTDPKPKRVGFFAKLGRSRQPSVSRPVNNMQQQSIEMVLRELTHPSHNEQLKNQQQVTFKLVKTVSDFTSQLSKLYERHSSELQVLVSNFRKRNAELRKERASCPSSLFHTWETLLQEVEADVVAFSNAATSLERGVAEPLADKTFHMKVQARKLFAHREGCEAILNKADDQLNKSRHEYRTAFLNYSLTPSPSALAAYYDSHNNYYQQLTATNAMLDQYHKHTLPTILQELEEILTDVTAAVSDAICLKGEIVTDKCTNQLRRYESLCAQARAVSSTADLAHLARTIQTALPTGKQPRRAFLPPYPPEPGDPPMDVPAETMPPVLRGEMLLDRMAGPQARMSYEQLRKDSQDLEIQIKQLQDSLDALVRVQNRGLENNNFSKVNEIQEEISLKKFDYRVTQLHLSAVRAQRDLFAAKAESGATAADRKLSSSSGGSMKNKWLKAFRSLKPPSAPPPPSCPPDKRNGAAREARIAAGESDAHNFQEYTYKKITPCDICSQVLRGHTRQGLRCRLCKMNVHTDCMPQVGKCQTKSKLLRRQKSTSELESNRVQETAFDDERTDDGWIPGQRLTRISFRGSVEFDDDFDNYVDEEEVDQTYQVLKRANEIGKPGGDRGPVVRVSAPASGEEAPASRAPPARPSAGLAVAPQPIASSSGGGSPQMDTVAATSSVAGGSGGSGVLRRRLFASVKSITMWGSRSRRGSPNYHSISLPERFMKSSKSAQMLRQAERTSPYPAPHSPRRQKLNLRMKSLSLDSPECGELRRRPGQQHTAQGSRVLSPSSPVQSRKMLSARGGRMSSVDLPDDHDKSLSSNSASPCPSPVKQLAKNQRLLPTNLYVVLYNFKSRHADELDLKAGYKVTVIDTSDPDWWKGKCLGKVGYFPSKYCTKLQAGERPLQVTHNLQMSDGDNGLMLLRDQIVIQVGEELDGMVMIRSGDNRQGVCPIKFLQEV